MKSNQKSGSSNTDQADNDQQQKRHLRTHVVSLSFTKMADSFIEPKLILSWLLSQLGASAMLLGLIVPIREAGALLPQLVSARWVRAREQKKWIWAAGSMVQGLCALGMVIAVLTLEPVLAASTVIGLLALLAIARSFCSVSYKDVLAKTLEKSTRGTATGLAGSIASVAAIALALLLGFSLVTLTVDRVLIVIGIAGGLWLGGSLFFLSLREKRTETKDDTTSLKELGKRFREILSRRQFALFVSTRALLLGTALCPPFILFLPQLLNSTGKQASLSELNVTDSASLGWFLLASSLATLVSSYTWGKLADRSSKKVLVVAAAISALCFFAFTALIATAPEQLSRGYVLPSLFFVVMLAYQGVRLGRSVHLVDMSEETNRAEYTAIANSIIGILLVFGSALGWLAQSAGVLWVFVVFWALSLAALFTALQLDEVQDS